MDHSFIAGGKGIIRVMRPQLPSVDRLRPYLERIDAQRVYSNHGPLVLEFEARLREALGRDGLAVHSAASGTAALVGAILAAAGRARTRRRLAVMPSYTFVATAVAAEQCGYEVYLADVDPLTWMLDPAKLLSHPRSDEFGVVIPVAPYGRPVPQQPWLDLRARTGVPVVIDGAAASDRLVADPGPHLGPIPVCLSFHATKVLACGEGGAIATTDPALAEAAGTALNFGFSGDRNCTCESINGKMSEYHAAVGLAELDGWGGKLAGLRRAGDLYGASAQAAGHGERMITAPLISLVYALWSFPSAGEARSACDRLRLANIEYRLWYGFGIQSNDHYARSGQDALPNTEALAPRLLGLPLSTDLHEGDIERIMTAVAGG